MALPQDPVPRTKCPVWTSAKRRRRAAALQGAFGTTNLHQLQAEDAHINRKEKAASSRLILASSIPASKPNKAFPQEPRSANEESRMDLGKKAASSRLILAGSMARSKPNEALP